LKGKILKLPLDKGNKFKEGSWEAYQVCGWCVFFEAQGNKGGEGVCEKKKLVLMCEKRLFMGKTCKQRAWKEVVCNK
jgi:hypothetical protein